MGKRCNLYTKKMEEPTIIEVDEVATAEINRWLDKNKIDFDVLISGIISILKIEIEKITFEDTQLFQLYLASGEIATVGLLLSEEPKCELHYHQDEYIFYLKNGCLMESCVQVRNGIKIGADVVQKKIEFGEKNTYIAIYLDRFDEQLYFYIQKYIKKLKTWDNIAEVICWIKSIPIDLPSYDLSIMSMDEGYFSTVKLSIIHGRIFRYIHINQMGTFQVDYDGAWEARYKGYYFKYDLYEHICKIFLQRGVTFILAECMNSFSYSIDLIKIMLGTIKIINNTLDKIEQENVLG